MPPVPARSRGFALIIVLWMLVLIAFVVAQMTAAAAPRAGSPAILWPMSRSQAAADGAIFEAIFNLSDPRPEQHWPVDGSAHAVQIGQSRVTLRLEDEAGRINPNLASASLLEGLLRAIGSPPETARTSPGDQRMGRLGKAAGRGAAGANTGRQGSITGRREHRSKASTSWPRARHDRSPLQSAAAASDIVRAARSECGDHRSGRSCRACALRRASPAGVAAPPRPTRTRSDIIIARITRRPRSRQCPRETDGGRSHRRARAAPVTGARLGQRGRLTDLAPGLVRLRLLPAVIPRGYSLSMAEASPGPPACPFGPSDRGRIRARAAGSGCGKQRGGPRGLPAVSRPSDRGRSSG